PRVIELTVPADAPTTSVKGCVVHRGPLDGWSTRVSGIAVTKLERTIVDLARDRTFVEGVVVADHALRRGISADALGTTMHRLRGTPGQQKGRRVLDLADTS